MSIDGTLLRVELLYLLSQMTSLSIVSYNLEENLSLCLSSCFVQAHLSDLLSCDEHGKLFAQVGIDGLVSLLELILYLLLLLLIYGVVLLLLIRVKHSNQGNAHRISLGDTAAAFLHLKERLECLSWCVKIYDDGLKGEKGLH